MKKRIFLTIFKQKLNLNRFDRILSHLSPTDSDIFLTESNKISLDNRKVAAVRSSHPGVFLGKGVLKICRHGCSPVNLLYISRTPFLKNTSWWLLLNCFHPITKNLDLFECRRWSRILSGRGSGSMLPQKIFKIEIARLV